jgi:serine protease inhibitor ecotin
MAFTMACPNFKKALKMVFGPLGVKILLDYQHMYVVFDIVRIFF